MIPEIRDEALWQRFEDCVGRLSIGKDSKPPDIYALLKDSRELSSALQELENRQRQRGGPKERTDDDR